MSLEVSKHDIKFFEFDKKRIWLPKDIEKIENNPRNWKFTLNLKGLLLYLIRTDAHNKKIIADEERKNYKTKSRTNRYNKIDYEGTAGYKTIYKIITNLAKKEFCINSAYKVLQHVMIIGQIEGIKALVKFLTDTAIELQNQLKLNASYLEYYILRRCYERIKFWYGIGELRNFWLSGASHFKEFKHLKDFDNSKERNDLQVAKRNILNELIPFHQRMLDYMKDDLENTVLEEEKRSLTK